MKPTEEEQARAGLWAAQLAFVKACMNPGGRPTSRGPRYYETGSLFDAAAELVEAVRLATVDFDPMRWPGTSGLKVYVAGLRRVAEKLKVAASGRRPTGSRRGGGEVSRRHLAVDRLLEIARAVLRGKLGRESIPWTTSTLSREEIETLSRKQVAVLYLAELFPDWLPDAPRRYVTEAKRRALLAEVAKAPLDEFGVFLLVARAHGYTGGKEHDLLKYGRKKD